jgi:hypothetical protein
MFYAFIMENQNKAWQARRLEKAYLRQAAAIRRRLAKEKSLSCINPLKTEA